MEKQVKKESKPTPTIKWGQDQAPKGDMKETPVVAENLKPLGVHQLRKCYNNWFAAKTFSRCESMGGKGGVKPSQMRRSRKNCSEGKKPRKKVAAQNRCGTSGCYERPRKGRETSGIEVL